MVSINNSEYRLIRLKSLDAIEILRSSLEMKLTWSSKSDCLAKSRASSEYVKARLFDDKFDNLVIRSQTLSTFERDLISCAKKAANFSYLAAKKLASVEEIDEASKSADSLLIEQGYKNKSNK